MSRITTARLAHRFRSPRVSNIPRCHAANSNMSRRLGAIITNDHPRSRPEGPNDVLASERLFGSRMASLARHPVVIGENAGRRRRRDNGGRPIASPRKRLTDGSQTFLRGTGWHGRRKNKNQQTCKNPSLQFDPPGYSKAGVSRDRIERQETIGAGLCSGLASQTAPRLP